MLHRYLKCQMLLETALKRVNLSQKYRIAFKNQPRAGTVVMMVEASECVSIEQQSNKTILIGYLRSQIVSLVSTTEFRNSISFF